MKRMFVFVLFFASVASAQWKLYPVMPSAQPITTQNGTMWMNGNIPSFYYNGSWLAMPIIPSTGSSVTGGMQLVNGQLQYYYGGWQSIPLTTNIGSGGLTYLGSGGMYSTNLTSKISFRATVADTTGTAKVNIYSIGQPYYMAGYDGNHTMDWSIDTNAVFTGSGFVFNTNGLFSAIIKSANTGTQYFRASLTLERADGSIASPTATIANDWLGSFDVYAHNGSGYQPASSLYLVQDGTWSGSTVGSHWIIGYGNGTGLTAGQYFWSNGGARTVANDTAAIFVEGINQIDSLFARQSVNTVIVDPSYTGSIRHYTTVQAGVNACPKGGTVIVYPGLYNESIQLRDSVNMYFYPGAVDRYTGGGTATISDSLYGPVRVTIGGSGIFWRNCLTAVGYQDRGAVNVFNSGTSLNITCSKIGADSGSTVQSLAGNLTIRCDSIITHHNTPVYCIGGTQTIYAQCWTDGHQGAFCIQGGHQYIWGNCVSMSTAAGNEGAFCQNLGTIQEIHGDCTSIAGPGAHQADSAYQVIYGTVSTTAKDAAAYSYTGGTQIIYGNVTSNPTSGYGSGTQAGALCTYGAQQYVYGNVRGYGASTQGAQCAFSGSVQKIFGDVSSDSAYAVYCAGPSATQSVRGAITCNQSTTSGIAVYLVLNGTQDVRGNVSAVYCAARVDSGSQTFNGSTLTASGGATTICTGGTQTFNACRIVNSSASSSHFGVELTKNYTGVVILNSCVVKMGSSSASVISSQSGTTFYVYGTSVSNTALDASVTAAVGTFTVNAAVK